jgi:hypothetical protein
MPHRSRIAVLLALFVGFLLLPSSAAAEPSEARGGATGAAAPESVERRFESAMQKMDLDLIALLEARMMECDGNEAVGGVETCWISPEASPSLGSPIGPVLR